MNNDLWILIAGAIIGIALFWFVLLFIDAVKLRRIRKRYNPDNDKSKQGEQRRKEGGRIPAITSDRELTEREYIAEGLDEFDEFKRRELLPSAVPIPVGDKQPTSREDSDSTGKTGQSSGNFFDKLRRKRTTI